MQQLQYKSTFPFRNSRTTSGLMSKVICSLFFLNLSIAPVMAAPQKKENSKLDNARSEIETEILEKLEEIDQLSAINSGKVVGNSPAMPRIAGLSQELTISRAYQELQNKLQELSAFPPHSNAQDPFLSTSKLQSPHLKAIASSLKNISSKLDEIPETTMKAYNKGISEKLESGVLPALSKDPAGFLTRAALSGSNPSDPTDFGKLLTGVSLNEMTTSQRQAYSQKINQAIAAVRKNGEALSKTNEKPTESEKMDFATRLLAYLSGETDSAPESQFMEEDAQALASTHGKSDTGEDDLFGGSLSSLDDPLGGSDDDQVCTARENSTVFNPPREYKINLTEGEKIWAWDYKTNSHVEMKNGDKMIGTRLENLVIDGRSYKSAVYGYLPSNPSNPVVLSKGFVMANINGKFQQKYAPDDKTELLTRTGVTIARARKQSQTPTSSPGETEGTPEVSGSGDAESLVDAARKLVGKGPCEVVKVKLPTPAKSVRCAFQVSRALKLAGFKVPLSNGVWDLMKNLRKAGWIRWNPKKCKAPSGAIGATNENLTPSSTRSHIGIVDGSVIYNNSKSAGGVMMARTKSFDSWVHSSKMVYIVDPETAKANPQCTSPSRINEPLK